MPQSPPIYPNLASVANPVIQNFLSTNCGKDFCWPIIWLENGDIKWYTYEITTHNNINTLTTNLPTSITGKANHIIDYTANPRTIIPTNAALIPSIDPKYSRSYPFITGQNTFNTVDLNYVWKKNENWNTMEFTTWYVPFTRKSVAERLIKTINRRPSWVHSAIAIYKQLEAANDLNCTRYIMACVNTIGKASNIIDEDGNAYWFDLSLGQITRLLNEEIPVNANFGTFKNFLNDLLT